MIVIKRMEMKNIDQLKNKLISTYEKIGDRNGLVTKGVRYSGNEIAEEIENETELGVKMVENIILLTIDLLSRDKINIDDNQPLT